MKSFKIFSGLSHRQFAQKIAQNLGQKLGKSEIKNFSCGETYVRFEETFRGKNVFIVQTGRTGQMNHDLIELFLMIDAAKKSFASHVHIVMPYFPSRDKIKFTPPEKEFRPNFLPI